MGGWSYNRKVADWVNTNLSFRAEYRSIFGKDAPYGNLPCPWHQGLEAVTPAAKVYGNVCHCFGACNRNFTVYDLLRKFWPERLRSIVSSGVIPEDRLVLGRSVKGRSFVYKKPEDYGGVVGSYDFYKWLIED